MSDNKDLFTSTWSIVCDFAGLGRGSFGWLALAQHTEKPTLKRFLKYHLCKLDLFDWDILKLSSGAAVIDQIPAEHGLTD